MLYSVILAGGSGTRLWPISTTKLPKQIKNILSDRTLLEDTYQRLLKGFSAEDIFVVSSKHLKKEVKKQLSLSKQHIFVEPEPKGTAMAIGLAAIRLFHLDPEATIAIINSDAYVKETEKYLEVINQAGQIAEKYPNQMVLIGIKPNYPETGYGYIEIEGSIKEAGVYQVKSFKEKPNLATAKKYLQADRYFWNPAIFVFKAKQILLWYQKNLPDLYESLTQLQQSLKKSEEAYEQVLRQEYARVKNVSIDYGLLEKMKEMLLLPADLTWLDIGNWRSLRDVRLLESQDDNVTNGKLISLDSHRNLLYSCDGKLIATIGVEDMILVETDKVIFLCPAEQAQQIKELLKKVKDNNLEDYL